LKSVNRRGDRSTHTANGISLGSPYNVGYQGEKSFWTQYGINGNELEIPYPIISGNLNNIPLFDWLTLETYAMQIAIAIPLSFSHPNLRDHLISIFVTVEITVSY
jgi:hypothetical protein